MSIRKFLLSVVMCSSAFLSASSSSAAMNVEIKSMVQTFLDNPIRAEQIYMNQEVQAEGEVVEIKGSGNGGFVIVLKQIEDWSNYFFNCELSSKSLRLAAALSKGDKIVINGTVGQFHRLEQGIFTLGNIVTLRDSVIVRILTRSELDFRKELKEAQEGSRNAMSGIAQRYENGDGVEQNYEEAVRWYRRAIDKRHVTAMELLAKMYREGRGVEKNLDEAMKLFRQSAENGGSAGMTYLGEMYEQGIGTEKNITEALNWYSRGARKGNGHALSRVKYYADAGVFDAQKDLADMYYTGSGVKTDYAEAFNLYSKIAEQDDTGYSYYVLAQMYDKGQGRGKNPDEAMKFYQLSSEKGNADSAYYLAGVFDLRGDKLQCVRYLKQAMKGGHQKAKSDYQRLRADFENMQRGLDDYRKMSKLAGSRGIDRFNAELAKFEKKLDQQFGRDKFNALLAEFEISFDLSPL